MLKNFRKIVALIIASNIAFAGMAVSAENYFPSPVPYSTSKRSGVQKLPTFSVPDMEAYPGETITVPITVSNNKGLGATQLKLLYGDGMTINGASLGRFCIYPEYKHCQYVYRRYVFNVRYKPLW